MHTFPLIPICLNTCLSLALVLGCTACGAVSQRVTIPVAEAEVTNTGNPEVEVETEADTAELSRHDEVSIVRHVGKGTHAIAPLLPAHVIRVCYGKSLLSAVQKFYPDYWFSELTPLPAGLFDVTMLPRDGVLLSEAEQGVRMVAAFQQSFGVTIEFDTIDRIATIDRTVDRTPSETTPVTLGTSE